MLSKNVKEAFSRAANIIRESIEVEGAIFFDASIGSFGGLADNASSVRRKASRNSIGTKSSSSDELLSAVSADSDVSVTYSSQSQDTEKTCGVLGYSTTDRSSINGDVEAEDHLTVPEAFLKALLRRYPRGKIFNFGGDGTISSSDSSGGEESSLLLQQGLAIVRDLSGESSARPRKRSGRKYSRRREAEAIIRIFPGARCLALVPLWDSSRERWFAGGVVWTHTPGRVLTVEGELSYLAAFGSTIMAEVARLDALSASVAKTDMLGAISHELRSPLHGILGSVELVQESPINAFQAALVYTIETCGRTLLDTIDHVRIEYLLSYHG